MHTDHNPTEHEARLRALDLMRRSDNCALATAGPDGPLCSLMACALSDDGSAVYMLTSKNSHKYTNLQAEPRASLLFDTRTETTNPHDAQAVTATGVYEPLDANEHDALLDSFLDYRPFLAGLDRSHSELLRITLRTLLYLPTPTESLYIELE